MNDAVREFQQQLANHGYLADTGLSTVLHLACTLPKPVFLEGEPGVGKTEVAKVLAGLTGSSLIRIQCYRGIEPNEVLYEWNYLKQIMTLRVAELEQRDATGPRRAFEDELFTAPYLVERPLLAALRTPQQAVVLIDEIDRADEEFEAFLLEFLADFQVTIPELGTIRAAHPPIVIITSNRTREVHDALRRRCLYHWITYPSLQRELQIVQLREPGVPQALATQLCALIQVLRRQDLVKKPGLAETLDWVRVLLHLGVSDLDEQAVRTTLGSALKTSEDLALVEDELRGLLAQAQAELERALPGLSAGDGRC